MTIAGITAVVIVFTLGGTRAVLQDPQEVMPAEEIHRHINSLIEAEKAFAMASSRDGLRMAFLSFLAEEAVVFKPGPVPGRPAYESLPPDAPTHLAWKPMVAEIARSGDWGYTSGPYEVRRTRQDSEAAGYGHYVSLWKKDPRGAWKVILDIGIPHEAPGLPAERTVQRIEPGSHDKAQEDMSGREAEIRVLLDQDRAFADGASSWGYLAALADQATDDVRVYRPGELPRTGLIKAKEILPLQLGKYELNPSAGGVSSSRDLSYTFGIWSMKNASGDEESWSYLKIWRKGGDGKWRICLDIALALPKST